ncbi:MAG: D-alanine-D-alanine ligase [Candidatus Azotimanducaceae bacterium]|jgi:D-alanine-D-alanine ligase
MKHIAVLCGGSSYEHEVSIITGMQVVQNLDPKRYSYSFIYFDKNNQPFLLKDYKTKKDFHRVKHVPVDFVHRDGIGCISLPTRFNKKIQIDLCYLAFHGGSGESGPVQGMLEVLGFPFTSPSQEGSVIVMNKSITKEVLEAHNVPVLPSMSVFASSFSEKKTEILAQIVDTYTLPVIIKPVHLGSSIGISIAHTEIELEKYLNVAVRLDTEILVEQALTDFREFNVSVRSAGDAIECSPIEEPTRDDEFLSFDDKYANGSKKSGGKTGRGGMELLDRTLPAAIPDTLADKIRTYAKLAYSATRLSGLVRIDFMFVVEKLYCTEINPIPGSMSFYLWEANGEQFREQITQSIEDSLERFAQQIEIVPFETDIVQKFVGS